MSWIKTLTGRKIDFLNPQEDQMDLRDIFLALARNHRFGGHSPMKVGHHILEVVALMILEANPEGFEAKLTDEEIVELAEIALIGMIHDMPEFAVGDMPTPLKRLLGPVYAEIEERILRVMLKKWRLEEAWEKHHGRLKIADQDAVEQEALRFGLDGQFIDEFNQKLVVPNEWVPERTELTLAPHPWSQELVVNALTMTWVKLMVLSGRADLVANLFMEAVHELEADTGVSMQAGFRAPNPNLPPLLVSGQRIV